MLKNDRGTILYLRVFKIGSTVPSIVNVFSEKIAGITFDSDGLEKAFKVGTLSGLLETRTKGSIALIKDSGVVVQPSPDLGKSVDIEKVEFTVVYPDGTTKMGTRSAKNGIGTLIWDDNLIRNLRSLNSDYFWTGDNKTNPAILVVKGGEVVDRACDPSTTEGCSAG